MEQINELLKSVATIIAAVTALVALYAKRKNAHKRRSNHLSKRGH